MILLEGNTYNLRIPITVNKEPLDINDVSIVEFTFENISKYYGTIDEHEGTVTYDGEQFIVPLTQEDTFELQECFDKADAIRYQARIKFKDDSVSGTKTYKGYIDYSLSKKVL